MLLGCSAAAATLAVTDAQGLPVAEAVVSVVVDPPLTAISKTAAVHQMGRRFVPTVTVIQTGTAVAFPNNDTVRHHVYSFSPAKRFEIKLYVGTPTQPIVFDRAGVATLGCNIHDRMLAWIVVVDSPYFAKSDASGVLTLDVPAGKHRLRVWHPNMGEDVPPMEVVLALDDSHVAALRLDR